MDRQTVRKKRQEYIWTLEKKLTSNKKKLIDSAPSERITTGIETC